MTFMFLMIAIGFLNAVSMNDWFIVLIFNSTFLISSYLFASGIFMKTESSKTMTISNLKLLLPERRGDLINELEQMTGVIVNMIEIVKQDIEKGTAIVKVTYYDGKEKKYNHLDKKIQRIKDKFSFLGQREVDLKINEARKDIWAGPFEMSEKEMLHIVERKIQELQNGSRNLIPSAAYKNDKKK